MRQLTFIEPGVLEWWDVPEPRLDSPKGAIVRPIAVARCDVDRPIVTGSAPFPGPFAFGHEFVAEVEELGDDVRNFTRGQQVLVSFQISCGECARCRRGLTGSCANVPSGAAYGFGGGDWGGALSELVRVPFAESMLVALPDGIDPASVASCDNTADGWRTVGPYLQESPGAAVLVVGGLAASVGLYAAAMAVALGASDVDYCDTDIERLEIAQRVGAHPVEGPPRESTSRYPITVDASASLAGLHRALRSVEPGGVCTSVGIFFKPETPVPLREMYNTGVTFKTGRVNARAEMPHVLDLVQTGRFHPGLITTRMARWDEAREALDDPSAKVVIVR